MAIIKQGIMGGFSGTIGNIVGSSWKGIDVMKSKPLSVSNPKTAAQQAQRGAFGQCVAVAASLLSVIIKPLWDRFSMQMSGFNAFVSENISNFDADGIISYPDLVISKGKMESTPVDEIAEDSGDDTIDIAWVADGGTGYKLNSDIPYCVLINETSGWIVKINVADKTRFDEGFDGIPTPGWESGDVLHAYLAFKRADGTVVSDTGWKSRTLA